MKMIKSKNLDAKPRDLSPELKALREFHDFVERMYNRGLIQSKMIRVVRLIHDGRRRAKL